jgi:hypothetical protein
VGRTADEEVGCQAKSHCPSGWHRGGNLIVAMLCVACIPQLASEARAQCGPQLRL